MRDALVRREPVGQLRDRREPSSGRGRRSARNRLGCAPGRAAARLAFRGPRDREVAPRPGDARRTAAAAPRRAARRRRTPGGSAAIPSSSAGSATASHSSPLARWYVSRLTPSAEPARSAARRRSSSAEIRRRRRSPDVRATAGSRMSSSVSSAAVRSRASSPARPVDRVVVVPEPLGPQRADRRRERRARSRRSRRAATRSIAPRTSAPVEEPHAADLVRDAGPRQLGLDRGELGVHPDEHRDLGRRRSASRSARGSSSTRAASSAASVPWRSDRRLRAVGPRRRRAASSRPVDGEQPVGELEHLRASSGSSRRA